MNVPAGAGFCSLCDTKVDLFLDFKQSSVQNKLLHYKDYFNAPQSNSYVKSVHYEVHYYNGYIQSPLYMPTLHM